MAFLTVLASIFPAVNVILLGSVVSAVAQAVSASNTGPLGAALFFAVVLAAVSWSSQIVTTVQNYLGTLLQYRLANEFNYLVLEKSAGLCQADFENSDVYDKLQLANRESSYRPYQLFSQALLCVSSLLTLVSVSTVLISWSPLISICTVLVPIAPVFVSIVYGRKAWRIETERSSHRRQTGYLQFLLTTDRPYKEARLFGLSGFFISQYRDLVEGFYRVDRRLESHQASATILSGTIGVVFSGLVIYLAIQDSIAHGDVGRLASYLSAQVAVAGAAQGLFAGFGLLYEHSLFLSNLFGFLDTKSPPVPSGRRPFPASLGRGIEFQGVSFRYPGRLDNALDNLSVTFPAGQTTALVGENGSGKTTIVKLLMRLYEPTSGRILLDGIPLEEYEINDFRRNVGTLFQDFMQYEATVRENIGYGNLPRIDDIDLLQTAAKLAGADETISGLPRGLDTQVGTWFDDGHQLSGGEWQRIALARVLSRSPKVLILDEPTASIDAAGEARIFSMLAHTQADRTTVLIAHRFSTVREAHRILVLDGGRLAETGDHDALIEMGGIYASLYHLQAKAYQVTEHPPG